VAVAIVTLLTFERFFVFPTGADRKPGGGYMGASMFFGLLADSYSLITAATAAFGCLKRKAGRSTSRRRAEYGPALSTTRAQMASVTARLLDLLWD
jgi:hypothetical protein